MQRLRHYRTTRQLDAVVDDELAESMRQLVECHLAECPECSDEVAVRRAVKDALGRYGDDADAVERLRRIAEDPARFLEGPSE